MRSFEQASKVLGKLEERVMHLLWAAGPLAVREVRQKLKGGPPLAYTTLMTTLDRLYKKGLLSREKEGQAFVYKPAFSRDEYHRRIVEQTVAGLISRPADSAPVLAAFIDAAATVDEANLDRLERLIEARRRSGK